MNGSENFILSTFRVSSKSENLYLLSSSYCFDQEAQGKASERWEIGRGYIAYAGSCFFVKVIGRDKNK